MYKTLNYIRQFLRSAEQVNPFCARLSKSLIFSLLLSLSSLCCFAQGGMGYERDTTYIKLNKELTRFTGKQDSLQNVITELRDQITADPAEKEKYANTIRSVESKLFDLQSIVAGITTIINGIKQDYILKSINSGNTDALGVSVSKNSAKFVDDFLQKNLTSEELKTVNANANIDSLASSSISRIGADYERLKSIDTLLRTIDDKEVAENLKNEADILAAGIKANEQVFKNYWNNLYETKLYAYRRILDILNIEQYVQYDLDKKEKELRRQAQNEATELVAPALNNYNRQKAFLREYELVIASKQGDDATVAMLKKIAMRKDTLGFARKKIELPKWDYVEYKPITFGTPYASVAQIPYIELPSRGAVFAIRVFVLSDKMKQISSLKSASPASYLINENGKWEYYLGVYRSQKEAQEGVRVLKLKGFSTPVITEFKDGGKVVDGTVVPIHVNDYYYSIELNIITPEITKTAKNVAPDKSFARVGSKYILGVFTKYTDALRVKDALGGGAKIVTVEKED